MNKEKKIIVKNYIALLFIQGANFILPLIILPYLVRVLGSEKFGLVMIAQSVAIFLTIIVDFGFNISATKEVISILLECSVCKTNLDNYCVYSPSRNDFSYR